jgi:hypothetical protein
MAHMRHNSVLAHVQNSHHAADIQLDTDGIKHRPRLQEPHQLDTAWAGQEHRSDGDDGVGTHEHCKGAAGTGRQAWAFHGRVPEQRARWATSNETHDPSMPHLEQNNLAAWQFSSAPGRDQWLLSVVAWVDYSFALQIA